MTDSSPSSRHSGVPLEWTQDEERWLNDWFSRLGLVSEREKAEHVRRIGLVVEAMYGGKIPDGTRAENAINTLAKAFLDGDLREDIAPPVEEGDDIYEAWREALGMNKSMFRRHVMGVGLLVYEVMACRPMKVETYMDTLYQIALRLTVRLSVDPVATAQRVRDWQKQQIAQSRVKGQSMLRTLRRR